MEMSQWFLRNPFLQINALADKLTSKHNLFGGANKESNGINLQPYLVVTDSGSCHLMGEKKINHVTISSPTHISA